LVLHARRQTELAHKPAADDRSTEWRIPAARVQGPVNSSRSRETCTAFQLRGSIFGENRGKRLLSQLRRHGELSHFLLVSRERAQALAQEAWGEDPGLPRDRKMQVAYLCAVNVISERGLDTTILTVTRAMRKAIHDAGFATPGLNGGEKGSWIADLLKGELQAFEHELHAAANRLEHGWKS